MLDAGEGAEAIASGALDASERAFFEASHDLGFKYTVWLLTRVALAAKKESFRDELVSIGLDVPRSCPDLSWRCGGHSKLNPTHS